MHHPFRRMTETLVWSATDIWWPRLRAVCLLCPMVTLDRTINLPFLMPLPAIPELIVNG